MSNTNNILAQFANETNILDEEVVAFKLMPDVYGAFYLGYLLGKLNADFNHNYSTFDPASIELHTKQNLSIINYIDEAWEVDHLQNIEAMRYRYPTIISYRGLMLYCLDIDAPFINRITSTAADVRTVHQMRTLFKSNNYAMVKISHNSYIVMSDVAYDHYLAETTAKPQP